LVAEFMLPSLSAGCQNTPDPASWRRGSNAACFHCQELDTRNNRDFGGAMIQFVGVA